MEYEEIVAVVRQASGGIGSEAADRALQATLQTLAERLPRGEARHIVQELPAELKPWIYTETDAEAFDIDEFLVRAAKREETDVETALRHARAVFFALGDALSPEAVAHLAASLPQTFDPLVAEAQRRDLDIMPADQFWARVRQRLGVDDTTARLATDAVTGDAGRTDCRRPGRGPDRPARSVAAPAAAAGSGVGQARRTADAARGVLAAGGRAGRRRRGRGGSVRGDR